MRRRLSLLLALSLAVAALLVLLSPGRSRTTEFLPRGSEHEGMAGMATPGTTLLEDVPGAPRERVSRSPAQGAGIGSGENRPDSRWNELAAALRREPSWAETQTYLRDLAAMGTDEALAVVLARLAEGSHHTHEPGFLADLLEDVDDPRIAVAAEAALTTSILEGRHDWSIGPYAKLMLDHGGPAAKEELLHLVASADVGAQLRGELARFVAMDPDPEWGWKLLDTALDLFRRGDRQVGSRLIEGLGEWRDPAFSSAILDLARDATRDPGIRQDAYAAWGRSLVHLEELSSIELEYRRTRPADRYLMFSSLSSALRNLDASDQRRALAAALPVLSEMLSSDRVDDRLTVVSFIGDWLEMIPVELASALRASQSDSIGMPANVRERMLSFSTRLETRHSP